MVSGDTRQHVAEGYKQSEVGVIPSDWLVSNLGAIGSFKNGINKDGDSFGHGGPLVNLMDVFGKTSIESVEHLGLIDSSDTDKKEYDLRAGDVLFIRSSVKPSGVGLTVVIKKDLESAVFSGFLIRYRSDASICSEYLEHCFYDLGFRKRIIAASSVSANTNINQDSLKRLPLAYPKLLDEQTAIANALSDVDALITSLEKLIAKKRAMKTAAMQQLLTGKKRLPPFDQSHTGYKQTELGEIPEDWDVMPMGALFEPKLNRKQLSPDELVTFIGMQDVSEEAKILGDRKVRRAEVGAGFTYFERGDVLVAKITPCFENGKGCFADVLDTQVGFGSTEFHVLRARRNTDAHYLYFLTITDRFRRELESEMIGSAGHKRVPLASIEKFLTPVPGDCEEQAAIALALSDMDGELSALQCRLAKTQQLKQGMMQELLTGRTRLL